ncbi:MAG: hypothetical protein ACREBZ_00160 [Thermoplasmata archaeon]
MSSQSPARLFLDLLGRVTGGAVQADVDGRRVLNLDGERRNLEVQIDPFLRVERQIRSSQSPLGHMRLWELHGAPSTLARSGWCVSFQEGSEDVIRVGRGVSPLTGHVHLSPAGLWKLRKLL